MYRADERIVEWMVFRMLHDGNGVTSMKYAGYGIRRDRDEASQGMRVVEGVIVHVGHVGMVGCHVYYTV